MALVSAGVEVNVVDQSTYVLGAASTVPLIFIATGAEKLQQDGITPALGTYESGVIRTVSSIRQALELYGVPKFYESADGQPHYGDARNEYGLDALLKYLEIGNRAYVVRANVNTNDNYVDIKQLWGRKISEAGDLLAALVDDYIDAFNTSEELYPGDADFKKSVTKTELATLINEAMASTYAISSFASEQFYADFNSNHTQPQAGYQDVLFATPGGGFIQGSDITELDADTDYASTIVITSATGTQAFNIAVKGSEAVSYGALVAKINSVIGAAGTAQILAGRIRVTSSLKGETSAVVMAQEGTSTGVAPLFSNLKYFRRFSESVIGRGPTPLVVYDDSYTTIVGTYDGIDGLIEDWNTGSVIIDEFTANEAEGLLVAAAADFDNTREFRLDTSLGTNNESRKKKIVEALQAEINSSENGSRGEGLEYNLTIAPGYFECADELLRLAASMKSEVFVIGETPFDKPPSGPNGIANWARTPARATSDSIAYYYCHGISSNIDGKDIMTTAGSIALRVYAFNDANAELWYAPAGVSRGSCDFLSNIGYVSGALGGPTTFVTEYLDEGQRDELYEFPKSINPITFIPGRGILVMGQKTTYGKTSALDRVNVSRLVKYMRRQIRKALFSWLFEPNDEITRQQVKYAIDNFCMTLVNRRALYDFATIVNESNNTPQTIDNNELHVDLAIKTVKVVEFIYATIRLVSTGANIGTGRQITVGQ